MVVAGNVVTASMTQARRIVAVFVPFTFNSDGTGITITAYTGGRSGEVIPSTVNGLPVTGIASYAFLGCAGLSSVTLPAGVTNIGNYAFFNCANLSNIYFRGNAPIIGSFAFSGGTPATVYYLPNTAGWETFGYSPAVLWDPQIQQGVAFGVQANCFGFTITNAGSPTIVVDAATNLTGGLWTPVSTNTLTGGSASFSDPAWTNYPVRFYRFRSP